jgi:hypothetical protein
MDCTLRLFMSHADGDTSFRLASRRYLLMQGMSTLKLRAGFPPALYIAIADSAQRYHKRCLVRVPTVLKRIRTSSKVQSTSPNAPNANAKRNIETLSKFQALFEESCNIRLNYRPASKPVYLDPFSASDRGHNRSDDPLISLECCVQPANLFRVLIL